ncbi:MAG: ArnT family glycosyltransferase [Microgenomates group bacterium]
MKEKNIKIFLFLVIIFALGIRIFKLGSAPPSMHWDEPSWGYNAWSILKTGKDEYGNFLPLIFKAFGDYKTPVYVYLTAISEAVFGLNEFAVRFPAAFFGTLSILLAFLVVKEIFNNEMISLLTSIVLAFSPWHYHYSHGAWEVNVLLVFLLLGIYFFLKRKWLVSGLFFGLCFHVYNSAKLITPLLILGLILFFPEKLKKKEWKKITLGVLIMGILVLPVFYFTFFGKAGGRLKVMSIFSYPRPPEEKRFILEQENNFKNLSWNLFHNNLVYFGRGILERYLNHFSPRFLFFEGDWSNHRHSVPYVGVLNHMGILFLPLGVYYLISQNSKKQGFWWYWLAIAPLPAALSRDIIQATRSYFIVIPLSLLIALGIYFVFQIVKKIPHFFKVGILGILIFGWFFSFIFYLDQFFIHLPFTYSEDWLYGYKQVVEFIKDKTDDYEEVVFTSKYGQPYIFWLFYSQYPPENYQKQAKLIEHPEGDVGRVERIDNIVFREIYWPKDRFVKKRLYIGATYEIPLEDIREEEARILKEINFFNGKLAFRIVETL